jgi:hypothetical protein
MDWFLFFRQRKLTYRKTSLHDETVVLGAGHFIGSATYDKDVSYFNGS